MLSAWATGLLRAIASEQLPRGDEIRLSWTVVWSTLSLSVATTFLFGVIPTLAGTRTNTSVALAHSSRSHTGGSGQILLRLLVESQLALAIVLLISISTLAHVPLGFQTRNVLTLHFSASWGEKRDSKRVQHRLERTLEALENVPGVESAALILNAPGAGLNYNLEFHVAGRNSDAPAKSFSPTLRW